MSAVTKPARVTDARTRILDAAAKLFAIHGFDATPASQIAREAGVPKGLVFYYFPKKFDILRTLLLERVPATPLCGPTEVTAKGDLAGSLLRLANRLRLGQHEAAALRAIIFREAATYPQIRAHLRAVRDGLVALTEAVLDAASLHPLAPLRRRWAADTYVAVMLDESNARHSGGALPDLAGAAAVIAAGLASSPPGINSPPGIAPTAASKSPLRSG